MSEALTNVAKRRAGLVVVSGRIDGRLLTLEVADDGCGGADRRRWGSGLQGLTDRLATLDGSLTVASPRSGWDAAPCGVPCA